MTIEELKELFSKESDHYDARAYEKLDATFKPTGCRDIDGFILIQKLTGETRAVVSAAEHDVIYLAGDAGKIAEAITPEQVHALYACGIHFNQEFDCLASYV